MSDRRDRPQRSRAGRRSLQRRVNLALVVAALVLAATLVGSVAALFEVRDRQDDVLGTYFDAITQTERGYRHVVNAETAVRGFLLTRDDATLEPLDEFLAGGDDADFTNVRELLVEAFGPDSEVARTEAEAQVAVARWYEDWAVPAMETVREDGTAAVPVAEVERGRLLFEDVRAPVEESLALLREGRAGAVEDLRSATFVLVAAVVTLAVMLLAGGVLLWLFLRRWVTRPLERLASDAREVAEGDLDHEVTRVGSGEVEEVSTVVEQMRTRLVRSLAEVRTAREELEESHARLREQTEDLARSNRDLEQFAYVASHDLQEPLRKVASFTQLLAKRYEGQLDERADQYIGFAVDGAKRMQRLINDLLGFSRVGRIGGELTDVDMTALVRGVAEDLSGALEEAGGRVVVGDLPTVRGEEPLLRQLVTNLVGNAVKFRHPERPPVVEVSARQVDGSWELTCADNGIGIDPQYADRVFVIFQRLHAKEVYEGTGIGLALCKKIVEYHGGDIWIDTDVTEGTTVRWTLARDAGSTRTGTGAGTDDQEVTA